MKYANVTTLNEIAQGNFCKVKFIKLKNSEKNRILDIGIVPNTILKVLGKSAFGDPTAYLVRGSVIALRCECTRNIIVEKI